MKRAGGHSDSEDQDGIASPLQAEFKPEIQYIRAQVGELMLAYYTHGEGEPLLLDQWVSFHHEPVRSAHD